MKSLWTEILWWIDAARAMRHVIVMSARIECGRLYVARDRPTWFLLWMTEHPLRDDETTPEVRAIYQQCRDELALRLRRAGLTLEVADHA